MLNNVNLSLSRSTLLFSGALAFTLSTTGFAHAFEQLTVDADTTYTLEETTHLDELVVGDGATIVAPDGYEVSLTVNGIETGQELVTTAGTETEIVPGTYKGDVVLTVTESNDIDYQSLTFPIRQAIYLDENGLDEDKSVLSAAQKRRISKKLSDNELDNISIGSTGECFNGVYVAGGDYTIKNLKVTLDGNGRSDLVGEGAAVKATGSDTRLVLDNAYINNTGVVRTAAIADDGANMIFKNSTLAVHDGILPDDYEPSADLAQMRGGYPVGGSLGNCRATNLLGEYTQASYINSKISAEGWGVLSTDGCTEPKLTAIDSEITITGTSDGFIGGYGSYAIGDSTQWFLGCTLNVAFSATSLKGGYLHFGDSSAEAINERNSEYDLGLTAQEIRALKDQKTTVHSQRFGIVCTGAGDVYIDGKTSFDTGETMFLNKGNAVNFYVDGSEGATLVPANGVLFQLMDNDGPGPTDEYYQETTDDPVRDEDFDVTSEEDASLAEYDNISLKGDLYNSMGWNVDGGEYNLVVKLDNSKLEGLITASEAVHSTLDPLYLDEDDYEEFGRVTNTPCAAINNGVIVYVDATSSWILTGTSYLTKLTVEEGGRIVGLQNRAVAMTVDGVETVLAAGTYTGDIVLTVSDERIAQEPAMEPSPSFPRR